VPRRRRSALLTAAALVGASLLALPAGAAEQPREALVSAHRGGAAYAPENTMVAFDNAVRLGVDELETDTQLTADGELVLLHDDTLDRTTDCTGAVLETAYADLSRCDAAHWWSPGPSVTVRDVDAEHPLRGTGVAVPRLSELLDLAVRLGDEAPRLSIELKNIPGESNFDPSGTVVATALVAAVEASGIAKDGVIVQSFFPTSLEAVKRLDPELPTQFLTLSSTGQPATANLAYVVSRDLDVLAPNDTAPDLTPQLVDAAHAAGKQVIPYTPDTEAAMLRALDKGVDGLITDRPACLLALLGRPGAGAARGRRRGGRLRARAHDARAGGPAGTRDVRGAAPAALGPDDRRAPTRAATCGWSACSTSRTSTTSRPTTPSARRCAAWSRTTSSRCSSPGSRCWSSSRRPSA
jgi:glycerophosphoryl diester phosphodiesterase